MKVWSLMYVVSVQSNFIQYMNWNVISWYTRTTNSFAVVCVVKILNGKKVLYNTLTDVLIIKLYVMLRCIIATFNQHVDVCLMSYSVSVVYVGLKRWENSKTLREQMHAYNVVWRWSLSGVQGQKTREAESCWAFGRRKKVQNLCLLCAS